MTSLTPITYVETDIEQIAGHEGRIAVVVDPEGRLSTGARRVNKLMRGALLRLLESDKFQKVKPGQVMSLSFPTGLAAEAVDVVHLPKGADQGETRKALSLIHI